MTGLLLICVFQAQPDSLRNPAFNERLLEQIDPAEDSPLLDLLDSPLDDALSLRSRISQSLHNSAGFTRHAYQGSPLRSCQRLKIRYGGVSAGILAEKDAGESRLNDFTTGYLM